MYNLKDLETKGYVVIPKFFSQELIEKLVEHYKQEKELFLKTGGINKNYPLINSKHFLLPELTLLIREITENTNITLDMVKKTCTYFDNTLVTFPWHVDHELYYLYQDTYNLVNCWAPIIKSSKSTGGLGLVPTDELASRCSEIFEKQILGRGAKWFKLADNETIMVNDDSGEETVLPFNIEEIAVYPEIEIGDMLVWRQDVIHKTDSRSDRVAVSVRCLNSNTVLTREKFLSGSHKQRDIMGKNPSAYYAHHELFVDHDMEQITIGELVKYQLSKARV
jgi:ectoine hydroxylase-related dioxygenase (phytanoyl-CoA dioxygenase family)